MEKMDLGERIAYFRREKGYTIKEMAEKTGLTSSMLSQIERGNANPSINSLRLIARSLDLSLVNLFENEENTETLVVKADRRPKVISPENEEIVYESLSPHYSGRIQFTLLKLEPGMETTETLISHGGEEAALVLGGDIRLYLEGKVLELGDGDSVRIPPGTGHKWENRGEKEVTVIFAVTPPSF